MIALIFVEQDDEDADMYEVPPCERPPVKVPPRHEIETNIYLGKKNLPPSFCEDVSWSKSL